MCAPEARRHPLSHKVNAGNDLTPLAGEVAGVLAASVPLGMPSGKVGHHLGWKPLQGSATTILSQAGLQARAGSPNKYSESSARSRPYSLVQAKQAKQATHPERATVLDTGN